MLIYRVDSVKQNALHHIHFDHRNNTIPIWTITLSAVSKVLQYVTQIALGVTSFFAGASGKASRSSSMFLMESLDSLKSAGVSSGLQAFCPASTYSCFLTPYLSSTVSLFVFHFCIYHFDAKDNFYVIDVNLLEIHSAQRASFSIRIKISPPVIEPNQIVRTAQKPLMQDIRIYREWCNVSAAIPVFVWIRLRLQLDAAANHLVGLGECSRFAR